MYNIARLASNEREALFRNTSAKKGLPESIIEKDFWVCFVLDYLFHKNKWQDHLAFKGGTSLSKAYDLIQRFSEDIDLILDWRVLGYGINEPWEKRSKTKQLEFNKGSVERLFVFLREEFLPEFKKDMSELLGFEAKIYISDADAGTVIFAYPSIFEDSYVLRVIRLEIGALAAWTPTHPITIRSYAAECYPGVFNTPSTEVLTTTAARTFWEKATILHQEAYRPEGSFIPERYSRHYYDLYQMAQTSVINDAISQPELLVKVAEFKEKFYPRGWARYDEARIGTLKLMPATHSLNRIASDFAQMKSMIYGDIPSFEELIRAIERLENEINDK